MSPFEFMFGTASRWHLEEVPFTDREDECSHHLDPSLVEEARALAAARSQRYQPGGETILGRCFAVSDQVLVRKARVTEELALKWPRPYTVTEAIPLKYSSKKAYGRVTGLRIHVHGLQCYISLESAAGAQ